MCPRAVVGPLRSPRDRSSTLALPHEFPVDSFVDRQYITHTFHRYVNRFGALLDPYRGILLCQRRKIGEIKAGVRRM
jgi:hypothetical protein